MDVPSITEDESKSSESGSWSVKSLHLQSDPLSCQSTTNSAATLSVASSSEEDSSNNRFNWLSPVKEVSADEKLKKLKRCMSNTDYELIAKTIKTVDSAVIASQVSPESKTPKKRLFSEKDDPYTDDNCKESRKCSPYLHPNLNKLQIMCQNHLKMLRRAEAYMEDYLDLQNKEPRGFPIPGFMRTSSNLDEWRKSEFSYDVAMSTADRIPICTYDPSPYKPDPGKPNFDKFFDFVKSKCCKISYEIIKYMVHKRQECLNTAYKLKHNLLQSAGDHLPLNESGPRKTEEKSVEKCSDCLDFVKQYADECNDSLNEPDEKGEKVIEEQIEHLLAELKITNSKNVSEIDKLTARFLQRKERLIKEEEMDKNAIQMWDLYLDQLKEPGLQRRKDELDRRKKEAELVKRKKENELAKRKKKRMRLAEIEEEEDMSCEECECANLSSEEENLNEQESEIFVSKWDTDIKKLLRERESMVLEYQKLKSKKIYKYMNEELILSLNKMIKENHPREVREQKMVNRYLRRKSGSIAPIVI